MAMEGEEEGVATAAIDSSKFVDMIVWEVVFIMMGKKQIPEINATTMVDDRRLYAVGTEKYKKKFDEEVGNKFNSKKSTVATSLMSQQKDIKKVATRQKLKYVTSENQVGYQLSQGKQNREVQNERAAKATTTINRIGTIRSIFTFEQKEHLVMSTGMTQHAFGVEGGDAGKKACASLTAAVTRTIWKDPEKEMRRNTVDHLGQRACD